MVAILYNIRSLHNVGSIFRTADAAGIEKIYLCGITPAPIDEFGRERKAISKVALGAERYVEWKKGKATGRVIDGLKDEGYKIFAIEQDKKAIPYNKVKGKWKTEKEKAKFALIVGNEVNGLPKSILKKADKILEIPMQGEIIRQASHPKKTGRGKESLNVAVAFGIVAFYLVIN